MADVEAGLVRARHSYWAGEAMVAAGEVMPAGDPRVREPFVEAFNPAPTSVESAPASEPAVTPPASAGRARRS